MDKRMVKGEKIKETFVESGIEIHTFLYELLKCKLLSWGQSNESREKS